MKNFINPSLRRGFFGSIRRNSNIVKNNPVNIYLSSIQDLCNVTNMSGLDKQILIERNWVNFVKIQHEDVEFLKKKYSFGLIRKLRSAKESLDIILDKKHTQSKFPMLHKYMNSEENLIITFATAQFGVLRNMGYTHICHFFEE